MRSHVVAMVLVVVALAACGDDEPSHTEGDSAENGSSGGGSSGGGVVDPGSTSSSGGSGKPWSLEPKAGIATYYDATGAGACSFDAVGDPHVVALGNPLYDDAALCGACLEVTGPKGTTKVRVVDRCPECPAEHLDLSREAFGEIGEMKDGRIDVSFKFVQCDIASKMKYRFKDGSSRYWTAIQVSNHRLPISKLEFEKDGDWVTLERQEWNYFLTEEGVGPQPDGLAVRVTSIDGQVVEDRLPAVPNDGALDTNLHDGTAQFE